MTLRSVGATLILCALVLAGVLVLGPLWPSLLLSVWFAVLLRGWHGRLTRRLKGRSGAAALLLLLPLPWFVDWQVCPGVMEAGTSPTPFADASAALTTPRTASSQRRVCSNDGSHIASRRRRK